MEHNVPSQEEIGTKEMPKMELALKSSTLGACRCSTEETAKQTMEEDFSLPDYCAPIRRVLKCVVLPNCNGVSVVGARASVGGTVCIRLIYVNDTDQLDCCEVQTPLSATADFRAMPEDAVVTAAAAVEYVNCRVTGQRRFSVGAVIAVRFCALVNETLTLPVPQENCGCETRTETVSCVSLGSLSEKCFDLSETVELPAERAAIGKLLKADGAIRLTDRKAANGKLLLKGSFTVDVLYCADGGQSVMEHLTHTMPISQILDAPCAQEDRLCETALHVCALQTQVRPDSAGENRLLEIAVKISALTKVFQPLEQTVILDCYATRGAVTPTFQTVEFRAPVKAVSLRQSVQQTLDLGGISSPSVADVHLLHAEATVGGKDGALSVALRLTFRALLRDADAQFQYLERTVETTLEERVDCGGAFAMEPEILVEALQAQISSGALALQFDAVVTGQLYSLQPKRVCVHVEADAAASPNEKSALTLCFAQKGASLWEIAKRYQTTCCAIRAENALQDDVLQKDLMLLVPSV